MTFGGTLLRRRAPRKSLLREAVAYALASRYSGTGPLLDLSGNGHDAQLGSTSGADTNDPLWLPYSGEKYLYLPGTVDNYASTPDSAAVSVTGDLEVIAYVAPSDWTPPAAIAFVSKWRTTGDQRCWSFQVETDGGLLLLWSEDGTTGPDYTVKSTVFLNGLAGGAGRWLKATLDVNNGSGGYTVRFYTSTDPAGTDPSSVSWSQLGAAVTAAGTTSVFDGSGPVDIGARADGVQLQFAGKIYRAQVYDGIDGTLVADFDPARSVEPHSTFVASTGETWTINRSATGRKAALVDRSLFLLGTDDYFEIPDHADLDFAADEDFTIVAAFRTYAAFSAPLIAKAPGANPADTGWILYLSAGKPNAQVNDGVDFALDARASASPLGEAVVAAGRVDRNAQEIEAFEDGAGTGSPADMTAVGSTANAGPVRIGRYQVGSPYADMEFLGYAIFRRALTDAEILRLNAEMGVPV